MEEIQVFSWLSGRALPAYYGLKADIVEFTPNAPFYRENL
jgi:hypothetical protein